VGENSFVWAPDSAHLAYSTAITPEDPTYHGIKLVDVATANSKWLTKDDVAAFFSRPTRATSHSSPSPPRSRTTRGPWWTLRPAPEKALGNFLATPDESTAYRYFDQLAVSHTIWSPDSTAFIYAA